VRPDLTGFGAAQVLDEGLAAAVDLSSIATSPEPWIAELFF